MRKIEVCCGSVADAIEAQAGAACRVELCAALDVGGLTPSYGSIAQTVAECSGVDVNVIIRPRCGDFVYNGIEIATMIADISACKRLGVHGVVIGVLTPDGEIDMRACKSLMEAAAGLSVTFHRAFDVCKEPFVALEQIISLGCDRILTSGQANRAEEGIPMIKELVGRAEGRIIIMPGAGITPHNISMIEKETGATEFHSTSRSQKEAHAVYGHPVVSFGENQPHLAADRKIVTQLVNL